MLSNIHTDLYSFNFGESIIPIFQTRSPQAAASTFPLLQRRRPCSFSRPSAPNQDSKTPSTRYMYNPHSTDLPSPCTTLIPRPKSIAPPSAIPTGTSPYPAPTHVLGSTHPANPLTARPPSFIWTIYPLHHHAAPPRQPTLAIASDIAIGKSRHINSPSLAEAQHTASLLRQVCIPLRGPPEMRPPRSSASWPWTSR
ncbi:hypothetical protein BDZ85DRAFT_42536 [Elsinoe ampelina]|uniref:Uncharacterized protein n=1 Tax=Elsinoe ampelina TaxID=302913 RepID=A0A6A6G1I6_9PEZI|nr:hypothetical protein BDZ85DRAFT_42536 [Elsinoe ampelina]